MKGYTLKKGLDIPLRGAPEQVAHPGPSISEVALIGDDYIGLKPTMLICEGDRVKLGQKLFEDKKNPGVFFTSPGSGTVKEIRRGAKRKFEAIIISLEGDEPVSFHGLEGRTPPDLKPDEIRQTLLDAGLWTAIRQRPFGRVPGPSATPSSLFITAMDTEPLAPDPAVVVSLFPGEFRLGLEILAQMMSVPLHLCTSPGFDTYGLPEEIVETHTFAGPHPAGLPSTHIHFIDPVTVGREVWHICYQDVIGIGHLFSRGTLGTDRIVSLGGPGVTAPSLLHTRLGASIRELSHGFLEEQSVCRILSGSVLNGRHATGSHGFLGRYHRQVTAIPEQSGRGLFNWLRPGLDRYSITRLFFSALRSKESFAMTTAAWGGERAIFPLGTYEKVLPLDLMATPLLKSLAVGDADKSVELGCLELVEEDLALCTFVCPGKNEYGPLLRRILDRIEREGWTVPAA